ncbi:membrane protein [Mycoplasmopsis californica]|uniref:DNA integrity scanning protein DisA nucleotide-binding domain protein n=1 Tax=Mycoplasmopsis equigenitalium TaxID=114883 RepID=A0ABY5J3C8_9BACT|nr:DNA integrity scanning protein DisA nucleotide-binding domain protein [Mycoplasmopsis equigenitalium]UUD36652.1 DNA integrity scanning protein DisA nucleotide-binding domain protein [Mycoplasmopsis equigenitalium]VEU69388.1 membrane protein [Mycoplasmopsis californica]
MSDEKIILILVSILLGVCLLSLLVLGINKLILISKRKNSSNYGSLGRSSQLRLINQLRESIEHLSETKTGAIITIENNDNLDNLRTDGVIIDANISSSLIVSIFNKKSPLHDGAIIIRNNKIVYASTFYKITKKSVDNKYGARHRAAIGISEVSDAVTIVVSEETGKITLMRRSERVEVDIKQFQEKLVEMINN